MATGETLHEIGRNVVAVLVVFVALVRQKRVGWHAYMRTFLYVVTGPVLIGGLSVSAPIVTFILLVVARWVPRRQAAWGAVLLWAAAYWLADGAHMVWTLCCFYLVAVYVPASDWLEKWLPPSEAEAGLTVGLVLALLGIGTSLTLGTLVFLFITWRLLIRPCLRRLEHSLGKQTAPLL